MSDDEPAAGSDNVDALAVQIDGEQYTVEENVDFDGDGQNDTSVMRTGDGGMIALADTDHDGVADVAVEYDEDGNVVAGAEYDPETGTWRAEDVEALPTPSGAGADESDPAPESAPDSGPSATDKE